MPPVVNITPRTLPGAGAPDRLGLAVSAADLLIDEERRRRQAALAAEQAAADRDLQRELLDTRGEQSMREIAARGEVQEGLIRTEGDVFADVRNPAILSRELATIGARGEQDRQTAGTRAELEADVVIPARTEGQLQVTRAGGEQDRATARVRGDIEGELVDRRGRQARQTAGYEFGLQRPFLEADRENDRLRTLTGLNQSIFQMQRELNQESSSDLFGGFSFGAPGASPYRLSNGDPNPGMTRGGAGAGGSSRTPPPEARGGSGMGAAARSLFNPEPGSIRMNATDAGLGAAGRGPDMDFDPDLARVPLEDHLDFIGQYLSAPEDIQDYLMELPPDMRQRVKAALLGG